MVTHTISLWGMWVSSNAGSEAIGLQVNRVHKRFEDGNVALHDVSLTIKPSEFAVLIGPSGCGKTTLLRMLGGLDRPSDGEICPFTANESSTSFSDTDVGYCFQEPRLLPWRTTEANVALPLELRGVSISERRQRARSALDRVGLSDAYTLRPHQLSGGMQMRASIARALVTQPKLLLMDEPFGSLDEISRARLDDELLRLWSSLNVTIVLVTHSLAEAVYVGQTVHVLSSGPGRLVGSLDIDLGLREDDVRSTDRFTQFLAQAHSLLVDGSRGNIS